jgi:uncharacterized membrane protein
MIDPSPALPGSSVTTELLAGRALFAAIAALAGLLVLWELWLAPIRPGGSWLALKALPVAAALPGLARRNVRTAQWLSLLLPLYAAEGVVRAWSEPGRVRAFASAEIVLALIAFVMAIALVRLVRLRQTSPPGR